MSGVNRTDQAPPLLSKEDKAVLALLLVALVVCLAAIAFSLTFLCRALPRPGEPIDAGRLLHALALFSSVFFGIVYVIFGRWPGSVTAEASMDFSQSPHQIWDAIALRDDYPGWRKIYAGIERLDEPGEVYRLRYAEDSECPACKLPRDPDRSRWSSRVEVREAQRPYLYQEAVFPKGVAGDLQMEQMFSAEAYTMNLKPLTSGGTRVTVRSGAVRPKVWLALLTLIRRPMREGLRSLKAHLDGTPDETIYGIAAKRIELARNAPQHCRCPEQL